MVNQRLTKREERCVIMVISTDSQDMDNLNKNIQNYNLDCKITDENLSEIKPVLYLSTNPHDVKKAITEGFGAATMFQRDYQEHSDDVLHVAFDGDGVLFSDESESVNKNKGLQSFFKNERDNEDKALELGPLKEFFKALVHLQQKFKPENCPIRTYLVTSRGTASPGLRVLKTLKEEKLEINEAFFLSGPHKGPVLRAINPHIFFDDQTPHIEEALQNGVIGAHVPYGVSNE